MSELVGAFKDSEICKIHGSSSSKVLIASAQERRVPLWKKHLGECSRRRLGKCSRCHRPLLFSDGSILRQSRISHGADSNRFRLLSLSTDQNNDTVEVVARSGGCPSAFLGMVDEEDNYGEEGWLRVRRRRVMSDLIKFCSESGRCFKCGLKGHHRSKCRFKGHCFRCTSPAHSIAIYRFFNKPLSPPSPTPPINSPPVSSLTSLPSSMVGFSAHRPIIL